MIGSLPIKVDDKLVNRSFLVGPKGDVLYKYDKIHLYDVNLPNGDIYRESDTYKSGNKAIIAEIKKNIDYKPLSLKNFSVSDIEVVESEIFIESISKLKKNHPEARISVRKSGTEPIIRAMVEAETEKDKDFILGEIESLIS